jgi:5-methyltetrahydrofolate--homocysteine methyltransferase
VTDPSQYQLTSWRDLPSLVVVRAGDHVTKAPLAPRFQEAIDEAAMRLGDTGSDDYLAGWTRGAWTDADGSPAEVADRVVADLEEQWPTSRVTDYLDALGPAGDAPANRLTRLLGDAPGAATVVLDGGMGTLLQDLGLDDGGSGELWNVDRPEAVRESHRAYAEAGARILTTNTFGGTRPRLQMHGLEDRVHELNEAAARIARSVADEHGILVAGDLGPTGELLEPLGTMTPEEAEEIFAEQLRGLRDGGIDVVLVETMSDLAEVEAAVRAARSVVPELPVIATMSFDTNLRTMMGVRPADAMTALAAAGVDAVGANCGRGPEEMEQIVAEMAQARPEGVLLVAQSNAGLPQVVGDHFEYDRTPADLANHALALRDLGVDLVGACCGSTPDHIAAIRTAVAG